MAKSKIDRYEGALLGVAVGDALGAPLEFMSADRIRKNYGTVREMIGGGWLNVVPGEVTDDTQMTLAVAEGIIESPDSPELAVGRNFLRWFHTKPKDIGITCRKVLSPMSRVNNAQVEDWMETSRQCDEQSGGMTAGNGALMRTVYPALYYSDVNTSVEIAERIGMMTHWNEDSRNAVNEYVRIVHTIVNADMPAEEAKQWLVRYCDESAGMQRLLSKVRNRPLEPTGYSINSLLCAMNAIKDTDKFENALVYAVNLGGDADTIGAIAGGLAGAVYGASEIPPRWINTLANQPNCRTVRMFCRNQNTDADGNANALVTRLVDLAHMACQQDAK